MNEFKLKEQVCEIGRRVYAKGFAAANDGNISVRLNDREVLCTPTMVSKGFLKPEDLCVVDYEGKQLRGTRKRSSEILLHLSVYKHRPDVQSVVHCHPPHATAFAVAGVPIPTCVLPEVEVFLGIVPTAIYETPGTQKFADTIVPHLKASNTIILANHGTITFGPDLEKAYWNSEIIDAYCKILILARQIGNVNYFTQGQTKELLDLKKKLGYDDVRFNQGDNCDLCSNDTFGRGYAEPAEACGCKVETKASSNGHAATAPDMERLVQLVTDQVMAALAAKSKVDPMKVCIIGGGGLVGSSAAYAIQCGGAVSSLAIIDANKEAALGHATELLQGACLTSDIRITAGGYDEVKTSNIVVITAGLRRKPDESRLDLINRNVDLFLGILDQVKAAGLKENSYLVVVSNPVDVLTYLAVQRSGLPWQRVLGLGTQLDTARFRGHLAKRLHVPASQVQAMILGEHGDSMVPIWSSAAIAGLPLEQWPGFTPQVGKEVFEETKTAGATMIKLKGGSGMAVGLSIRAVVEALARDSRHVLPVSSLQHGLYGVRDVCLSVPTVVGCGGARQQIELTLTTKERLGVQQSARVLREIIDQVEARIEGVPPQGRNRSAIPRSAWQPVR